MKRMILMALSLLLVLVLSLSGVASAYDLMTNASFETGDTTGWTETVPVGASISVVTTFTSDQSTVFNPKNGAYFAVLKTDGPGSLTKLSQSLNVLAGETISGWAFFDARDYVPYNDWAEVVILDETMVQVASVFYADTSMVGNYGETAWTAWSHTFASAGTYTVEARITNSLDSILDSYMGFDVNQGNKVTGGGTVDWPGGRVTYGFTAREIDNGNGAKGQFVIQARDTKERVKADIVSLAVDGTNAWMGGIVTQSNSSWINVGDEFIIRVVDNGEGKKAAPDQISSMYWAVGSDVSSMPLLVLLDWTNGNVQVHEVEVV